MLAPPRKKPSEGAKVTAQTELLTIAGRTLPCTKNSLTCDEGGIHVEIISWSCVQVPGFLVRSETRTNLPGQPESYEETELLGFGGRLQEGCDEPIHPWADFAPGAWVRLSLRFQREEGREQIVSQAESYQRLLRVTPDEVALLLERVVEGGERQEEELILSLKVEDAAPA